nr:PTS mannitol transporter subunit IICB [Eubacterium barkeri]
MVIPNIGAFMAFGIIAALFIETGWIPNADLATLVSPILQTLLPLLIGYTGGEMFGGKRGAVCGAVATMGVVVGADIPMFLAAMIVGPLAGFLMKKVDQLLDGKIKSGFEMLVNNFTLAILACILCCLSYKLIGPGVAAVNAVLSAGIQFIMDRGMIFLSPIIVEPAKVLFLNNALDHGILGPLGYQQVETQGYSMLFLLVTNPGTGLGLLLAYWKFAKGEMKESAPGNIIIHFFGGIHEVYFPYVLAQPLTLIPMILGGMSAILCYVLFQGGCIATPSPGSIFAVLAMTPARCMLGTILGIIVSTVVSFVLNSFVVKHAYADFDANQENGEYEKLKSQKDAMKAASKGIDAPSAVHHIVVACDAGMGSSAMAAANLKKKIKAANLTDITVVHSAISKIPSDADLILTHIELLPTAQAAQPNKEIIPFDNYLNSPVFIEVVERLKKQN